MGPGAQKLYVSSYLFDRGVESGIIKDSTAISWESTPAAYKQVAEDVCKLDLESVKKNYPRVQQEHAQFFCMDLSYCYSVLVRGFKIPESSTMTMVKQIEYKVCKNEGS